MGLARWKNEKTGKERRKTGLLIQRKIGKSGKTRSKKEKKRKKLERERSFLNGNAFLSVPIPTNFGQRTSLVPSVPFFNFYRNMDFDGVSTLDA